MQTNNTVTGQRERDIPAGILLDGTPYQFISGDRVRVVMNTEELQNFLAQIREQETYPSPCTGVREDRNTDTEL